MYWTLNNVYFIKLVHIRTYFRISGTVTTVTQYQLEHGNKINRNYHRKVSNNNKSEITEETYGELTGLNKHKY